MPRLGNSARQCVFAVLIVTATIFVGARLELGTNVTHFMPDESASELARLAGELTDSELTRTWVLSVAADHAEEARKAARALAQQLATDPAVEWVRFGNQEQDGLEVFELYYPRRHYFLSANPEAEIPGLISTEALERRAEKFRLALAQPGSEFMDSWLQTDPLGGFEAIVGRLQSLNPGLRTEAGQFMSRDGRSALVLFGTSASAFDSGAHAPLLDRIEGAFDELVSQGGEGLVLEQSSAHRFAVHAEREIRGDVIRVSLFSFVGVAILFLVLVGAMRSFLIVILPPLVGILGALALSLLVFGSVDGLTIVFGIALMGVAIDYSIHVLVHYQFGQPKRGPWEIRDLLRLSLFMGAVTTMASFVGLGLTPFPAFREMAFFAVTGLGCALCTTLWLLPTLLDLAPLPPKRSVAMANALERWVERLLANRAVLWLPVVLVVAGLPSLAWVSWSDDLSELSNLDPGLMAEDRRVRGQASSMDGSRFVIAVAPDRITAVRRNDEVARRLEGAVAEGHVAAFSSLHHVIWSPELQARNWSLLVNDSGLAERVEAAFVSRGFQSGLFLEFAEAFAADPPPPLTLEELEGTSMAEVLNRYEFPVGDRVAVVSYLRGVVSAEGIEASLEGVEGARLFDQTLFMNAIYREFRAMTLQQMLVGGVLVIVILVVRYRSLRLAIAACLPALLVGPALLELFVLLGVTLNLLHVLSLILVLGMGVDYGIFLLDAAERGRGTGPTLLGLALACMTTILVFGALVLSSHPALYSVGLTTGLGMLLALAFSPVTLLLCSASGERSS